MGVFFTDPAVASIATLGILPPVNTVAPAISGTEMEGETLTCSQGTWTGEGTITYAYQWERSGTPIGGATSTTYVLTAADVGETLTCVVSASNAGGTTAVETSATGTIAAAPTFQSLSLDGSTDYLSMTHANFGSASHTKLCIMASVYIDSLSTDRPIFQKGSYASSSNREYRLTARSDGAVEFFSADSSLSTSWVIRTVTGAVATAGWYAIKFELDTSLSAGSRGKITINGSAATLATNVDPATLNSTTDPAYIGHNPASSLYMDGFIHQVCMTSGSIPTDGEVFDGTAGKLKDLSGLTGLYFHIGAESDAVTDTVLGTAWTNNGTVTVDASVP